MTVIYICTDTRWQSVNLVPALAVGDIDSFVFLSARRGGDFRRSDDAHAERPQRQFIAAYDLERTRRRINRPIQSAGNVLGPVVGFQFWRHEIAQLLASAPREAEIVINYLSGPSDVKAAAWLAAEEAVAARSDLRLRFVLYDAPSGTQQARLEWNERNRSGWVERTESIDHLLSLDGWLSLHGFVEAEPIARLARQKLAESLQPEINRMFDLVYRHPELPSGWYVEMSGSIEWDKPNDLQQLAKKYLAGLANPSLKVALTKFEDIAIDAAKKIDPGADPRLISLRGSHDFIEFFRSGWFEMLLYLECRRRLAGKSSVEILFDLKLSLTSKEDEPIEPSAYQIDVGIAANNQFHCIECKAYRATKGNATKGKRRTKQSREHLNHLRRIKEELVGPAGVAVLASALSTDDASSTARYAELGDLEFAAGWDQIDAALDRIVQRCG